MQGKYDYADENGDPVKEFEIKGIPPGDRGQHKFTCWFIIDQSGLLMVKAALGEHVDWESLDQSILHEHILQIQEDDD